MTRFRAKAGTLRSTGMRFGTVWLGRRIEVETSRTLSEIEYGRGLEISVCAGLCQHADMQAKR